MARIVTYTDRFGARSLIEHALRCPSSVGDRTVPAAGVALGIVTEARVSGGAWIARCPNADCSGREYVNFDAPLFFCCECRNAATGHQPITVTLPAPKTRAQIETVLLARPVPTTRNWRPEETVKFLRDENRAHGIDKGDA